MGDPDPYRSPYWEERGFVGVNECVLVVQLDDWKRSAPIRGEGIDHRGGAHVEAYVAASDIE